MNCQLCGDVCSKTVLTQLCPMSHKPVLFYAKVVSYGVADVCDTARGVPVAF